MCEIYYYFLGKSMFRQIHYALQPVPNLTITLDQHIHTYSTRGSQHLHIVQMRTKKKKKTQISDSFIVTGCDYRNSLPMLPNHITHLTTLHGFPQMLKNYYCLSERIYYTYNNDNLLLVVNILYTLHICIDIINNFTSLSTDLPPGATFI